MEADKEERIDDRKGIIADKKERIDDKKVTIAEREVGAVDKSEKSMIKKRGPLIRAWPIKAK
ncbi:hypothetical protein PVA17_10795 [Lysinibacillus sp. CNPSo 3705]|uniref:hypothetical protein n=1 Tax=Lysinibacillus sp. CNPSo 3705 TaxID=3028148 RepID=UPI0023637613|nr:hypothetical protein [Lysinibacillus sp. CNPSo 3705]MDD1503244.1 hypothetical protein [Lysinibacillus sp. CNPSo 3705]